MTAAYSSAQGEDVTQALTAYDAFPYISPSTAAYATLPIAEGFNWSDCLAPIDSGQWYLVVFRSERRATADDDKLIAYDDSAYAEACDLPGFIIYFRGEMNARRECLSFCLWESQEQARAASQAPLHHVAKVLVDEMYVWYTLERYTVTKHADSGVIDIQVVS